jgi:fluoride exporter
LHRTQRARKLPPVQQFILVALGGALGAVARWKAGGLALHHTPQWRFPVGTFAINVIGCLVAGILAGLVVKRDLFAPDTRLFLFTGVLGGFTTFSAFGVETVYLLRRGEHGVALAYVVLSVACGVGGLWLMMSATPGRAPN